MNFFNKKQTFRYTVFNNNLDIPAYCIAIIMSFGILTIYSPTPLYWALRLVQFAFYFAMIFVILYQYLTQFLLVFSIVSLVVLGTWFVFPYNRPALLEVAPALLMQIFYFFVGLSCENSKKTYTVLYIMAFVDVIFIAILIFVININSLNTDYDKISNGLFWSVLVFYLSPQKNKLSKALFIIAFLLMLIYGRRSHVIYLLLVIAIMYVRNFINDHSTKHIVYSVLILLVCLLFSFFYKEIISIIIILLNSIGAGSRNISKLLTGEFFDLNGREELYELALKMLNERPLTGYGIGSTMVRWEALNGTMDNYLGCNTHNSILEIGAEFGIIGMGLFVVLHFNILKKCVTVPIDSYQECILFTLLGTGFVAVLIGSSYINNFQYALFLGYFINALISSGSEIDCVNN